MPSELLDKIFDRFYQAKSIVTGGGVPRERHWPGAIYL